MDNFLLSLILTAALSSAHIFVPNHIGTPEQNQLPDFTKKEDMKALGVGKIIKKDHSIFKKITLYEVRDYWIVYIKDGSIHDLMIEKIVRIEFGESKWGPLKIEFPCGKPKISEMVY